MTGAMKWFRWHHDTCEDAKFRHAARNALVTVRDVIAVWAALLESASRNAERGIVTNERVDFIETVLDINALDMDKICMAMEEAGLIQTTGNAIIIPNWGRRQFETDLTDPTNTDRQKRHREKKRQSNGDVTESKRKRNAQSTDNREEKGIAKAIPKKTVKAALPPNWFPNEGAREFAHSLGFTAPEMEQQVDAMADYAAGRDWRMADWNATFRNWLRKAKHYGSNRQAPPRNTRADSFAKATAVIDEMRRRENGSGETDGSADIIVLPRLREGTT